MEGEGGGGRRVRVGKGGRGRKGGGEEGGREKGVACKPTHCDHSRMHPQINLHSPGY